MTAPLAAGNLVTPTATVDEGGESMTPRVVFPPNDAASRAGDSAGMTTRINAWRRWLACCCLAVAWALANWGSMVLQPYLTGWRFTAWWLLCAGLASLSVVLASMEVLAAWRGLRAGQRRCQRDQSEELEGESLDRKRDAHSGPRRPDDG